MKHIPSRKEYLQNPEFWGKEMLKPNSRTTDITLIVLFIICAPTTYFVVPKFLPQYSFWYKLLALGMSLFAIVIILSIVFEKQLKIYRIKKEFRTDKVQIIKDSKGEEIIVIEE